MRGCMKTNMFGMVNSQKMRFQTEVSMTEERKLNEKRMGGAVCWNENAVLRPGVSSGVDRQKESWENDRERHEETRKLK